MLECAVFIATGDHVGGMLKGAYLLGLNVRCGVSRLCDVCVRKQAHPVVVVLLGILRTWCSNHTRSFSRRVSF